MKREHTYEINVTKNTVVITNKFLENATQYDSEEFKLYQQFKAMKLHIVVKKRGKSRKNESPLRSLTKTDENKKPLISFTKMAIYISLLDNADEMMDEFDLVRELAKSEKHPRQYVNAWFREQFPNYEEIPEFDENNRVVYDPNHKVA